MAQVKLTPIVINRPIEEVFALLSNYENNSKWASGSMEHKKLSPGPIGVGTKWQGSGKFLGQRMETVSEVTEYEPNRKYSQKTISGSFPFEVRMIFERVERGTRVNVTVEGEPGGFFKLAEPLVVTMTKRQFDTDFAHLKDLMEGGAL